MYSEKEASAIRQKFWTSFGLYMAPVPSASGEKINWINYKTGIKGIYFKADADNNRTFVAIEISLPDKIMQQKHLDIFLNFRAQFESIAGTDWDMRSSVYTSHGKDVSRISTELNGVNIFRENQWPDIIAFLKKNMTAFDAFWHEFKPAFEYG